MNLQDAHCSESQLAHYTRRDLPWRQLLQVDRHLEICADCAGWLARRANLRCAGAVLRAVAGADPHLPYEQLEGLAEGRLGLTGILEAHVRGCRTCRKELEEMRVFVSSFRVPIRTQQTWFEMMSGWFERPLPLAGAAVALAAISAGLLVVHGGSQSKAFHGSARDPATAHSAVEGTGQHIVAFDDCSDRELARSSREWYALYQRGEFERLAEALRQPADAGNKVAQVTLGILIANGQGTARDLAAARGWLRMAASQGDDCARQMMLALE